MIGGERTCNLSFPVRFEVDALPILGQYENNYQTKKEGKHTARTTTSTPPSISDNPIAFATQVAKLVVSSVVVLHIDASQPTGGDENVTSASKEPPKCMYCAAWKRDNPKSSRCISSSNSKCLKLRRSISSSTTRFGMIGNLGEQKKT